MSHTFEAGLRSRLHPFEGATLPSTIAFYRGTPPLVQAPGATNTRSYSPGAPIAGTVGIRITF